MKSLKFKCNLNCGLEHDEYGRKLTRGINCRKFDKCIRKRLEAEGFYD